MVALLFMLGLCGLLGGGIWWLAAGVVVQNTYPVDWGRVIRWFLLGVLCFATSYASIHELQKIQRERAEEAQVIGCPCGCGCRKEAE